LQTAALKLSDPTRSFYNTYLELHAEDATWKKFKKAFRERFTDVHTDQYNFMILQMARQAKNEGPQEFADRCRALAQKIMCKDSDPVAQQIHRKDA
jgi:predicted outer membrane protein